MEIDLRDTAWPECMIQCNDALVRLQPGTDVVFTVRDPDVFRNILWLVKSKPDCRYVKSHRSDFYRIRVKRI